MLVRILNLGAGSMTPKINPQFVPEDAKVSLINVDKECEDGITTQELIRRFSNTTSAQVAINDSHPMVGRFWVKEHVWEFLEKFRFTFDVIMAHRFLEHVPVDKLLTLIYLMRTRCETSGYCDIIVPDWNRLRQIDIDEEDELMTNNYLTVVYELCNYPKDPHASIFTPKKLRKFFELEGGWKHIETQENYNYAGRDIYFRSFFEAI